MTTDIHAIIAAAKRFEHCDVTNCCNDPEGGKSLMLLSGHCIAMAEALANIKDNGCPRDAFVANRVLSQIVEEAKR